MHYAGSEGVLATTRERDRREIDEVVVVERSEVLV